MKTILLSMALMLGIGLVGLVGCNEPAKDSNSDKKKDKDKPAAKVDHGEWCAAHCLPEEICWACNKEFRDKCEKEGTDWCKIHARPQSQCFKCDPKIKEKWEKYHMEKYGTKAPEPDDY